MMIMIGLIVGGLWGRSWLDAVVKSLLAGAALGVLVYLLLSPEMIEIFLKGNASWLVGLASHLGFLLVGALLGFALRKAVRDAK